MIEAASPRRAGMEVSFMANHLRWLLVVVWLSLVACATPPVGHKDLLDFLDDGVTQREDVHLHLGEPSARYEGSRIYAYRLAKDEAGYVIVGRRDSNWYGVQYNLMLVFDREGLLRRHSLVEVRSP
jgi:hypothetical protein